MRALRYVLSVVGLLAWMASASWMMAPRLSAQDILSTKESAALFARDNLVAWCIVPFDASKRTPEQRARMLKELGIQRLAYDYRAEHIPQFEEEIQQLARHGIELTAWWFPGELNEEAKGILALLEKHHLKTQLWVTGGGGPVASAQEQTQRVAGEVARLRPIAEAAERIGCQVGLYNHGGWFGEPENQIEIIHALGMSNVGIVYNQHHGHDQIDRFESLLQKMLPHLIAVNLNGMIPQGDRKGQKIVPLGGGSEDRRLLQILAASGYRGPIGILNHTDLDAQARLEDNLRGLDWLLDASPDRPESIAFTTWKLPAEPTLGGGLLFESRPALRLPPITVQCQARLDQRDAYNILVASDAKSSGEHWELYTEAGSGRLAVYVPGSEPSILTSSVDVCDGKSHLLTMGYEANRMRLWVDGRLVLDSAIAMKPGRQGEPGQLAVGRLVEGSLQCIGQIDRVAIDAGLLPVTAIERAGWIDSGNPLAAWDFVDGKAIPRKAEASIETTQRNLEPKWKVEQMPQVAKRAIEEGSAERGAVVFASAKLACLSCHRIGEHGGNVGPQLNRLGVERSSDQIAQSLYFPNHQVDAKYRVVQLLTDEGETVRGFLESESEREVVLRDPNRGETSTWPRAQIERMQEAPSLMPEGLMESLPEKSQWDLIAYLADLGKHEKLRAEIGQAVLSHAQPHDPTPFPYDRDPIDPQAWPSWQAFVNRDRVYDYYTKQANYFREQDRRARLLEPYPGMDRGKYGHWGNQKEETWANGDWNQTELGSMLSGVFNGIDGKPIGRAICLRLGDQQQLAVCFHPDRWRYEAQWRDGFVGFSTVRHGFMDGLLPKGKLEPVVASERPEGAHEYLGFYRVGPRVVFAYRVGEVEYLEAPWAEGDRFVNEVGPRATHSMRDHLAKGPPQWPQRIVTEVKPGHGAPYATDTIGLPWENPWKALMFCGDLACLPDGSVIVCTMQGDVWKGTGFTLPQEDPQGSVPLQATWRRIASGLHQPLGIWWDEEGLFVLGRDQLTRLVDLNGDEEIDFYQRFSGAYETSPAGHDFICGLQRDDQGRFYTASGNQGLVRISRDGRSAEVLAEGFRNPDGLGLHPDGTVTVPCSEGEWTPTSMLCAVDSKDLPSAQPPFYGYRGARFVGRPIERPRLPLVYLPRGLDNSSGGQVAIDSDRWGPVQGQMVHFSFGTGSHFLLLRDQVEGQWQGAVVPLAGEFLSGAHRGRFSPRDGQLYVGGMGGWGSYTPQHGCLHRVRYTGGGVVLPIAWKAHENGVWVRFSEPISGEVKESSERHFAQAWNYRYSSAYGSAEYSTRHYGVRGHDRLEIRSSHRSGDGRELFLEIPDLPLCNQLHLQLQVAEGRWVDLFATVNQMAAPRDGLPGVATEPRQLPSHPIDQDLVMVVRKIPNPWGKKIEGARELRVETGKNLSYLQTRLEATVGERLAVRLVNPDVVPHNWVLLAPGAQQEVGEEANRLIGDPEAVVKQYVPQSSKVICHTDVVEPKQEMVIYFQAPSTPGRYPYLCTFPGHWMAMQGELIVREAK